VIKSIKPKESKIQLSANSEFLEEPATEDEELVYYLRPYDRSAELEVSFPNELIVIVFFRNELKLELPVTTDIDNTF